MMHAVRSLLNSRFLSPSSARLAVVSSPFSIRCRNAFQVRALRGGKSRRRGPQHAPQAVSCADHHREQRCAQAARRRCLEGELPPQFVVVRQMPVGEQHQPAGGQQYHQKKATIHAAE